HATKIARAAFDIHATKLRPDEPFMWASKYFMPIYNDNRMFLAHPEHRKMVAEGFADIVKTKGIEIDFIAGTSTAGIAPGTSLADLLHVPFTYVRDKPKDHGLKNQIEGLDNDKDYGGKRVLVVEDLISTGGSSAAAVHAVRNANGKVDHVFSIYHYGLDDAVKMFDGKIPFDKNGTRLNPSCQVHSLLSYDHSIKIAQDIGYVTAEQAAMLKDWRADPFGWGAKHGWHYMRGKETAILNDEEAMARQRVCLALDVSTVREGVSLADGLSDLVGLYKIGKELHAAACNEGVPIVQKIYEAGGGVFLDLKLHDTPQTAYKFFKSAVVPGVEIINLHIPGGEAMCKEAMRGAQEAAAYHGMRPPKVIGVTVLTSLNDEDLKQDSIQKSYDNLVLHRAENAKKWGLDGIVCPANKAGALEKQFGEWLYVTPGIEWGGNSGGGQKQLYTPDMAVRDCQSSILVIGSAITKADDKRKTAKDILKAMATYT
ncbi:MAG TPA: orotidine-5'-phosphate decarboxylase, partial [Candidatus Binatia bacterium]|nr:orotidine-5'-phosphate decarboxylase [Candidatus Binatia bacterium]